MYDLIIWIGLNKIIFTITFPPMFSTIMYNLSERCTMSQFIVIIRNYSETIDPDAIT